MPRNKPASVASGTTASFLSSAITSKNKIKRTPGERAFMIINVSFMVLVCVMTIYPFLNTLAVSFNEGPDALKGGIYLLPRKFTLRNFTDIFSSNTILQAYGITVARTVVGVIISLLVTGMMGYGLSKKKLLFRKTYMLICAFAMIFNPGLIPVYMLYKDVGLLNNFLVYVLPSAVSIWNMILMKTFFERLPEELEHSAMIDGCNSVQVFFKIIIPVSMPIIATICIFNGVAQWNSWFDAYMFCTRRPEIHPIQTLLYKIIALSQSSSDNQIELQLLERLKTNVMTIRAATVVVTVIPILFIYSIFQKHFIQGAMMGSLKG
jgi:putative aldouronate transport system permease protein